MCGFTGHFDLRDRVDIRRLTAANSVVRYRGPDDQGYLLVNPQLEAVACPDEAQAVAADDGHVFGALGFRRLSIIDLSYDGHQPMTDDGSHWIVYNGEIYNYVELRARLESLGHSFRTQTDTEVLLRAYVQWGEASLRHLNGMFAFCILDRPRRRLFCARDRLGIKPFVYWADPQRFMFGSEVKQLLELLAPHQPGVDQQALFDYLAFGIKNHSERTFFEGARELRGGHFLTIDLDRPASLRPSIHRWWSVDEGEADVVSIDEAARRVRELLAESARLRLRSDVPIGTALSGGVDSAGIVATVNELLAGSGTLQKVFTITSSDPDVDESRNAELVIATHPVEAHTATFEAAAATELDTITWHHDQPVSHPGVLGGWSLARMIGERGVIVNLNGQGGDELMSGYLPYPHALVWMDLMRSGGLRRATRHLRDSSRRASAGFGALAVNFTREVVKQLAPGAGYRGLLRARRRWIGGEFMAAMASRGSLMHEGFDVPPGVSTWQQRESYRQLTYTHLPHLLHHVDRDSMAYSLEARTPFLDYRLVEYVFGLPPDYKVRNGYTKYVYRRAMDGMVPAEVLWNPVKSGFAVPDDAFTLRERDYVLDLVSELPSNGTVFPDRTRVEAGVRSILAGDVPYDRSVWRMLTTLVWQRTFKLPMGVA